MEKTVRTIYSSALQTAQMLGMPLVISPNTTLNERFAVLEDAVLPEGVYPRVKYFCIGNGGHRLTVGADGIPLARENQHYPTDAACFKPLPFVLRADNNDLSALERSRYALRVSETHSGARYFAYYLKRIPMQGTQVTLELRNVATDGTITSVNFVPTPANLVPLPRVLTNAGANLLSSDYITCAARLSISLSEQDCTELLDACRIIFSDDSYAIISEMGLCSGLDKVILLPDNTNFAEAIGVQVTSFINTVHHVKFSSSGISGYFDLGSNEPMFSMV
jgi:hypothetical protein